VISWKIDQLEEERSGTHAFLILLGLPTQKEKTMRAISIIRRWLSPSLGFMHQTRLASVWSALHGLVSCGKASLTAIGRASDRCSAPKHRIKAVDRLLGNKLLHRELVHVYAVVTSLLVGRAKQVVVIVDWTQVNPHLWALRAAVPIGGRALPIYSEVHPAKRLGNRAVQRRFLERLKINFPDDCRVIVLSDAAFSGSWFAVVRKMGWDFVGRVRGLRRVKQIGASSWQASATLRNSATTTPTSLGTFHVSRSNPYEARLVSIRKKLKGRKSLGRRGSPRTNGLDRKNARSAREPWLLATSLMNLDAIQIVRLYESRMQIEELFRDEKNSRFGWSFGTISVGTSDPHRVAVLLLLVALGVVAMTLLGLSLENRNLHRRFQANTIKTRRILSLFVLGTLAAATGEHDASVHHLRRALVAFQTTQWLT
jgi:hypothetical protein